jgi:hypothetical protein
MDPKVSACSTFKDPKASMQRQAWLSLYSHIWGSAVVLRDRT